MIVHCPSCDASNDVPVARFSTGGEAVACSSCGHEWIAVPEMEPSPPPQGFETGPDIQHLMRVARQARDTFEARRKQRHMKAAAWAGLLLLAVSPLLAALAFPDRVVAAAPAAISIYEKLGRDVNIYGLDIRRLTVEHLMAGGHPVIAITGELANISGEARKSPWLRFSFRDERNSEVYSWQLDTGAQPVKPGESRRFATKLASPPQTARKVEIRFARADEIGSNAAP